MDKPNAPPVKILLLMSGSIACAKASGLVSAWVKAGHEVRVAATRSVAEFLGHATLEGFSGHPVFSDAFAQGEVMDHIHLARWADIVVAAPATSNLINKLAAGIADDAVTSLWQAAYGQGKPMFIAPAMNTHMWLYPATQDSVRRLQSWGIRVLPTGTGDLACGEYGEGRMLEPEAILEHVRPALLRSTPAAGMRILITAGGTREPIDSVRYIGNLSTGRTAAALAETLSQKGHQVTWLGADQAVRPQKADRMETYITYADLSASLERLLQSQRFDLVIHAAAVSDFSVDRIESQGKSTTVVKEKLPMTKLSSTKLPSNVALTLHLKPNPKLLDKLRTWSINPDIRVIGFKLTDTADQQQQLQAIARLFEAAGVHAVVHNDLHEMREGQHPFWLHTSGRDSLPAADPVELASRIEH
ncbi:MAG: bifunctional phosphopantothenoylcysteine decarboxylase/phosphopantothenate--cysteine ligase CoaBC, partial [Lysobacterales bacterium]